MIAALRGAVACGSDGISWPSDNYDSKFPGDDYAQGNDRFNLRMGERMMVKDFTSIEPSVSYGTVKNPQNPSNNIQKPTKPLPFFWRGGPNGTMKAVTSDEIN